MGNEEDWRTRVSQSPKTRVPQVPKSISPNYTGNQIMKNTLFLPRLLTALSIAISAMAACAKSAMDQTIWSDRPATDWQQECLPIGNGHLGAMIFGGVGSNERIQFNEDSLWIGDENRYRGLSGLWRSLHNAERDRSRAEMAAVVARGKWPRANVPSRSTCRLTVM